MIWRKRTPEPEPTEDEAAIREAAQAQADARAKLRRARAQDREVRAHGAYWRRTRERNHFTEMISELIRSVKT